MATLAEFVRLLPADVLEELLEADLGEVHLLNATAEDRDRVNNTRAAITMLREVEAAGETEPQEPTTPRATPFPLDAKDLEQLLDDWGGFNANGVGAESLELALKLRQAIDWLENNESSPVSPAT
jgi:hypothetical protein